MKNYLKIFGLIAIIAVAAFAPVRAQSQSVTSISLTNPRVVPLPLKDTSTNGSTATLGASIGGYQNLVALQVKLTTISGTATGVIRLYGSVNGTDYYRIPSIVQKTGVVGLDSAVVDVNNMTKIFVVDKHAYTKYQVKYISGSSQSVSMVGQAIWRRQP